MGFKTDYPRITNKQCPHKYPHFWHVWRYSDFMMPGIRLYHFCMGVSYGGS
jgi:hypothetical protein